MNLDLELPLREGLALQRCNEQRDTKRQLEPRRRGCISYAQRVEGHVVRDETSEECGSTVKLVDGGTGRAWRSDRKSSGYGGFCTFGQLTPTNGRRGSRGGNNA